MEPIRIYIGFDSQETVAFHALSHSLHQHARQPISITPVMLEQLSLVYERPAHALASTEFSFSRFLVPFLANYQGWALFMDCDMLCRTDISSLWQLRDDRYSVQVVKHEHAPTSETKFNGQIQTRYQKKNWSSMMLLNCARLRTLSIDYVNHASGLELHQFKWLESDNEIGELPATWNHLVGYDSYDPGANLVHFTEGGPYFSDYRNCDYADEWFSTFKQMTSVVERKNNSLPQSLDPLERNVTSVTSSDQYALVK